MRAPYITNLANKGFENKLKREREIRMLKILIIRRIIKKLKIYREHKKKL